MKSRVTSALAGVAALSCSLLSGVSAKAAVEVGTFTGTFLEGYGSYGGVNASDLVGYRIFNGAFYYDTSAFSVLLNNFAMTQYIGGPVRFSVIGSVGLNDYTFSSDGGASDRVILGDTVWNTGFDLYTPESFRGDSAGTVFVLSLEVTAPTLYSNRNDLTTVSFVNQPGSFSIENSSTLFLFSLDSVTFNATAAPELPVWAMMLLGFAGMGFAGYLRKKKNIAFAAT